MPKASLPKQSKSAKVAPKWYASHNHRAAPKWHSSFSARGWRSVKKTIESCRTYRKQNVLCTTVPDGHFSIYEIMSKRFPGRMIVFPVQVLNGF